MIDIYTLIILSFAHFVGDFVFQQIGKMSVKKGECWWCMLAHIAIYTITLLAFTTLLYHSVSFWMIFIGLNTFMHLIIDCNTSVVNAEFYKNGNLKMFWISVGFDQFLHMLCLVSTCGLLKL